MAQIAELRQKLGIVQAELRQNAGQLASVTVRRAELTASPERYPPPASFPGWRGRSPPAT